MAHHKKYKCIHCGSESDEAVLMCRSLKEPKTLMFHIAMYDRILGEFIPVCEKCKSVLNVWNPYDESYTRVSVIQFVKLIPFNEEEE